MAFALVRHRFRGRAGINVLIFLPMATPELVMGTSLLALFVAAGVPQGFWTIVIAHVMFCVSFVVVTVKARLAGMDRRLEEAAMDLYASEWQTFRRITLPLVLPGIVAAALLAFSLSLRRLHHHELQRRHHRHVPDVRLGCRPARHPAAGQRDRHGDVRDRAAARRGQLAARCTAGAATAPRSRSVRPTDRRGEGRHDLPHTGRALADAAPVPYWLDRPERPTRCRR